MKKKITRSVLFGSLAFLGCVAMIGIWQACFVESFFLHAMVFPINPRTISQPTDLTYIGIMCQALASVFLVVGVSFWMRAAWLFFICRRNHVA
jgi:hypothetical protein